MSYLLLILPLLLLAAVGLLWRARGPGDAPLRPKAHGLESLDTLIAWTPQPIALLNAGERAAHTLLMQALPGHLVLAQVPLARFLKVPTRHSYGEWLRRAGQLCADLVVCDEHSQVIAVVEVQPSAPESERSARRRSRLKRVLKAAGIPVHEWQEGRLPRVQAVRDAILLGSEAPPLAASAREPAGLAGRQPAAAAAPRATPAEPAASTWYADLDSAPVPLTSIGQPGRGDREG